jgi:hypothetical protein
MAATRLRRRAERALGPGNALLERSGPEHQVVDGV